MKKTICTVYYSVIKLMQYLGCRARDRVKVSYIGIPVYSRIFFWKICGKLASQKCGKICGILPKYAANIIMRIYAAYMRIILFSLYNRIFKL